MTALEPGNVAPDFSLPVDDGRIHSLKAALGGKGALLFFFKTECPTCQLTMPFVERLYRRLQESPVAFLAVGQNTKEEIAAFRRQFGISFPVAMESAPWPVSDPYGLTSVPTFFLVDRAGKIVRNLLGHSKEGLDSLLREASRLGGMPEPASLFTASDASVRAMQPG